METILDALLAGEVSVDTIVCLLKSPQSHWLPNLKENIPEKLKDIPKVQQEFIPFFLNYLRDQTLHLLQSTRSANPSPAKTPSAQKLKNASQRPRSETSSSKRVQLFGASPGDGLEDARNTSGSVFSPNASFGSPNVSAWKNPNHLNSCEREQKHNRSHSANKHAGNHDGNNQRTKHRFSLGEFIVSPEVSSSQKRKNSPFSGGRKGDRSTENSPSPMQVNSRHSGNKKRQSLDSVTGRRSNSPAAAPVFSLINDFPPMGSDKKNKTSRNDLPSEKGDYLTNLILRNSPNFENTPKAFKSNPITKSRCISFTSIPQDGTTDSTQSPSRRIKPTPVSGKIVRKQNRAFLESKEETGNDTASSEKDCLTEERELLRLEKVKRLQGHLSGSIGESAFSTISVTPTKLLIERSNSVIEIITADRSEVTHIEQLETLIQLYSSCFRENLFPNIAVELYFLMQLLTSRSADVDLASNFGLDLMDNNYFASVHNAVYFAVNVLEYQTSLLKYIDKGTLRLLAENPRIGSFSSSLSEWLTKVSSISSHHAIPHPKSPIGGVSFQAETDNRKNFPNDRSFHLFKRQRDGFYELIREWESNHMTPGWSMIDVLGERIRALISCKTELSNYLHFARLFQSQLITMCKGDGSFRGDKDDDSIALLSQLKRSNPAKFQRLQERFSKPLSFGGPCPLPSFPGCQEFFHDFIIAASSPIFNQHLSDTFASKVTELNKTSFTQADREETGNEESDEDQAEVFSCILVTVRLLGKFLGFVTFLPYQTPTKLPDEMEATYILLRKNQLPALDILDCLKVSYYQGRITLTVPWVVEFLCMMDNVAPNIEYFQLSLYVLLYIHKYSWRDFQQEMSYTQLIIMTMISWLFENPVIPEGFYFSDIPSKIIALMSETKEIPLLSLDSMNFVDQSLFYTCCPYLAEMKILLMDFANGCSSKHSTIRKITPVSAEDSNEPTASERQIQLQLQENFFHNHPASLKRTVDFVAERTASNFIKKFRASLLQKSITDAKLALSDHLMSQTGGSPGGKAKDKLQHDIMKISQEHLSLVKQAATSDILGYCRKKIEAILPLLLPDEQSVAIVSMATDISVCLSQEKVHQWIHKHITLSMYQTELLAELDRLMKSLLLTQQKQMQGDQTQTWPSQMSETSFDVVHVAKEHCDDVRCPSDVLIDVKDMVKMIVIHNVIPEQDKVQGVLNDVKEVINKRQDMIPGVFKSFGQVVKDLALCLLTSSPNEWLQRDKTIFIELWKGELNLITSFASFMSSQVIQMLRDSPDMECAWKNYTDILILLIAEDLLICDKFQRNCLCVLASCQDCIELLGFGLCRIVKHFKNKPSSNKKVDLSETLEWIYQLCGETSSVSKCILDVIDADFIRSSGASLLEQGLENLKLDKSERDVPINCDSDNGDIESRNQNNSANNCESKTDSDYDSKIRNSGDNEYRCKNSSANNSERKHSGDYDSKIRNSGDNDSEMKNSGDNDSKIRKSVDKDHRRKNRSAYNSESKTKGDNSKIKNSGDNDSEMKNSIDNIESNDNNSESKNSSDSNT